MVEEIRYLILADFLIHRRAESHAMVEEVQYLILVEVLTYKEIQYHILMEIFTKKARRGSCYCRGVTVTFLDGGSYKQEETRVMLGYKGYSTLFRRSFLPSSALCTSFRDRRLNTVERETQ